MPSIARRLERAEEQLGGRGGCPTCWNMKGVNWEFCWLLVGAGDKEEIPTCPDCGRQPKNVLIEEYIGVSLEAV